MMTNRAPDVSAHERKTHQNQGQQEDRVIHTVIGNNFQI